MAWLWAVCLWTSTLRWAFDGSPASCGQQAPIATVPRRQKDFQAALASAQDAMSARQVLTTPPRAHTRTSCWSGCCHAGGGQPCCASCVQPCTLKKVRLPGLAQQDEDTRQNAHRLHSRVRQAACLTAGDYALLLM